MEYHLRETFEMDIKTANHMCTITYQEATLWEYIEFTQSKDQAIWLLDKLKTIDKHIEWGYILEQIVPEFVKTLFKQDNTEQEEWGKWAPFTSSLAIVCKEYCIPPHILMNTYTFRQFNALVEGVVWNYNEQNKKGKAKNSKRRGKRIIEMNKEKLKRHKEFFDELEKYK